MKSVEVPLITQRPACLEKAGETGNIIECADYYIDLLVSHAPAEITSENSVDGKRTIWTVRQLHDRSILHVEEMRPFWHRMILARIAFNYMDGTPYGGFSRMELVRQGCSYSGAFYLGNDGLTGFWFKGICGPQHNFSIDVIAAAANAIRGENYTFETLVFIRSIIDNSDEPRLLEEVFRIGQSSGLDREDAVYKTMPALEALADQDMFSGLMLMAHLWPITNSHEVGDGIDLWMYHNMSTEIKQALEALISRTPDMGVRKHYQEWLQYKVQPPLP